MVKKNRQVIIVALVIAATLILTSCQVGKTEEESESSEWMSETVLETGETTEGATKEISESQMMETEAPTEEIEPSDEMEFDEKTPAGMINSTDDFVMNAELVFDLPSIDENFRIMQGGCVTDEYAYFLIVSAENYHDDYNKECYVVKYDRLSMEKIFQSEPLKLGHANDLTYIAETHELYAIHGHRSRVSVLDADTLTVKEVKKLDDAFNGYALDYNQERESFVMAINKLAMVMFDCELKPTSVVLGQETGLVTQGICADARYVYHVLYSTKSNEEEPNNMVYVIDWDGNLVAKIPIGLEGYEPENISLVGDVFYIGCNDGKGGVLFAAKLVKE